MRCYFSLSYFTILLSVFFYTRKEIYSNSKMFTTFIASLFFSEIMWKSFLLSLSTALWTVEYHPDMDSWGLLCFSPFSSLILHQLCFIHPYPKHYSILACNWYPIRVNLLGNKQPVLPLEVQLLGSHTKNYLVLTVTLRKASFTIYIYKQIYGCWKSNENQNQKGPSIGFTCYHTGA